MEIKFGIIAKKSVVFHRIFSRSLCCKLFWYNVFSVYLKIQNLFDCLNSLLISQESMYEEEFIVVYNFSSFNVVSVCVL